jgi:hypothetical protein
MQIGAGIARRDPFVANAGVIAENS